MGRTRRLARLLAALILALPTLGMAADRPFRIEVVDDETGRGVPLVELKTTNQIRYVTDSNGIVAFDEPGLLGTKVFFHVQSHGYEYPKDGFGIRGVALETQSGGSARIKIKRLNIAQRLYRVTGAGIYRDSMLTGASVPIREPVLNGQVLGQDSVLTALFKGKVYWFWGDTNRPSYPLGNFHVPGAVSELPGRGGLDPARGVDLTYFLDANGFARPTCQMPGEGPTWITGLVVLWDRQGAERMFANYVKIRPPMETYERGLVEWDAASQTFQKRAQFSMNLASYPGEHPGGHAILYRDRDDDYFYYCNPFPLVRIAVDPERLKDPEACEAFTCLEPGTRFDDQKVERGSNGRLQYGWKRKTQVVSQEQQDKLIKAGLIKPDETYLNLRDVVTGKAVLAHGGTVNWNAYRGRWILIAVEVFGSSFLGEVWYAEADSPLGPWVYARKIATHDNYSFYNPKQHPLFDQEGGRFVYFEGTYTTTFSGNKEPTPRYDYNQVMYRLDLADPRLVLPVPVHAGPTKELKYRVVIGPSRPNGNGSPAGPIAFFAPDRPGPGLVAIALQTGSADRGQQSSRPATVYVLPAEAEKPPPGTALLHEFREESGPLRYYSVETDARPGYRRTETPVGRVWTNPSRLNLW